MIMCASSSWPPIKDASALLDMYELDPALNSTSSTTPTAPISDASAILDMYELVGVYPRTGLVTFHPYPTLTAGRLYHLSKCTV